MIFKNSVIKIKDSNGYFYTYAIMIFDQIDQQKQFHNTFKVHKGLHFFMELHCSSQDGDINYQ